MLAHPKHVVYNGSDKSIISTNFYRTSTVRGTSPRTKVVMASIKHDMDRLTKKAPVRAPNKQGGPRPPPLPPLPQPNKTSVPLYELPFASRRNITFTMLGGSVALWLWNHKLGPIRFSDKPDIPFKLLGFTDLSEDDFVYFQTPGGNWVAASKDDAGRLFMIDQAGNLYYDSGNPKIGMYLMDPQGNLFNYYMEGRQRKITPVGNVSDLRSFKISEVAGVKLDQDVNIVAFEDGRQLELPPGAGFVDENGQVVVPGELVEGYTQSQEKASVWDLLRGSKGKQDLESLQADLLGPSRIELDLQDPTDFQRQIYDQVLLDDPTLDGFQPALPDDFDLGALVKEVEQEAKEEARRGKQGWWGWLEGWAARKPALTKQ